MLLCGRQVANAQMRLCFFFLLNHPRPKRDLLLCVARHTAVTLTRNAPLSKAPSPGISVSRVEPSGVFVSRFCLSSSRSLGRCLLLGQRSRMNFFSHHIRSRNAPLPKAPSPAISVSRVEPPGVSVSRFCLSSSRSLARRLLLGQRRRR